MSTISVLTKNSAVISTARATPTRTGRYRCRMYSSSTQATINGRRARQARLSQPKVSWTITAAENPYTSPPTKAAGDHRTHRSSNQNMDSAVRAGISVEATFMAVTGPNSSVTGDRITPMAGALVSLSRLNPAGWNSQFE